MTVLLNQGIYLVCTGKGRFTWVVLYRSLYPSLCSHQPSSCALGMI